MEGIKMNLEDLISIEKKSTKKFAAKSSSELLNKRRNNEVDQRMIDDEEIEYRLPFQRDRDRIIHSRAFRRLMHKTQIFNANKGDHYRNRLTHTLEVSQIARSISKNLGLNEELTEAIALGHDLGHTPFGHIGERTLHLLISGKIEDELNLNKSNHGGFKHNFQSLQIIDNIEKRTHKYKGLNLTLAVREGILKHTGSKIKIPKKNRSIDSNEKDNVEYNSLDLTDINIDKPSFTLEGQVVAISDEIAQCTHDLEDGIRAKIIRLSDIEDDKLVKLVCDKYKITLNKQLETVDIRNSLIRIMIGFLINDVCNTTEKNIRI
jgi:dGTPase